MTHPEPFTDKLKVGFGALSPAEKSVATFILENREEALIASASSIAKRSGSSDATVVRTAKALGFQGLEEMRRVLAAEIRDANSPARRMERTLDDISGGLPAALENTLKINQNALETLQREISAELFETLIRSMTVSKRVATFGIGPSGAMAEYLSTGLGRLGIDTYCLNQTGLLLADKIQSFRNGDLLFLFAYDRQYQELEALLKQADKQKMTTVLVSDKLGPQLQHRVTHVVPVPRGRIKMQSMHVATLALIEAILVGVAMMRPDESLASLESLNEIRAMLENPAL